MDLCLLMAYYISSISRPNKDKFPSLPRPIMPVCFTRLDQPFRIVPEQLNFSVSQGTMEASIYYVCLVFISLGPTGFVKRCSELHQLRKTNKPTDEPKKLLDKTLDTVLILGKSQTFGKPNHVFSNRGYTHQISCSLLYIVLIHIIYNI